MKRQRWEGPESLAPGKHKAQFDFKYDGLGFATLAFNNLSGLGRSGTGVPRAAAFRSNPRAEAGTNCRPNNSRNNSAVFR